MNIRLILPAIKSTGRAVKVKLIDNYKVFVNHPELFNDGIHPTEKGAAMIAENVSKAITAKAITKQKK